MKADHLGCPILSCGWKNVLGGSKQPAGCCAGSGGWSPGGLGSWPFLLSHSDLSLLMALGSEKDLEDEIRRWFWMETCDKHQHKWKNNLKELGKWEGPGAKCRSSWKKCKGIRLRQNNPQTRYSRGRELLKHIKNRSVGYKMGALDTCRDHGAMCRRRPGEGAGNMGSPCRTPTYRWDVTSLWGMLRLAPNLMPSWPVPRHPWLQQSTHLIGAVRCASGVST